MKCSGVVVCSLLLAGSIGCDGVHTDPVSPDTETDATQWFDQVVNSVSAHALGKESVRYIVANRPNGQIRVAVRNQAAKEAMEALLQRLGSSRTAVEVTIVP
jgi:hypothetical protein